MPWPGVSSVLFLASRHHIVTSGGYFMETMLRDRRAVLAFVGPALLIYSIIILVPIIWSLGYTVFEGNVIAGFQFVGLHNYGSIIKDPSFWQAFLFTVKYA